MNRLAIVGAGSWGTALSIALAPRFDSVRLWVNEPDLAARIAETRENPVFLPGFPLPDSVTASSSVETSLEHARIVLGVMPSRFARAIWTNMLPWLAPDMLLVTATKGLEANSLLRISQVVAQVIPGAPAVAVLSGPTFAKEIARGEPAALVVSSSDAALAAAIQSAFSGPAFRLYTNSDPIGVEIGAALKNVVAIGAGVCQGLGLGSNTLAALITRGLAEIGRLAVAMGGLPATLAGLAGLGDLVLTCTGDLSRNRAVGIELARGRPLAEITGAMCMVAEGVDTTASAVALARKFSVDMPITFQMDRLLLGEVRPREAIRELMERSLKDE